MLSVRLTQVQYRFSEKIHKVHADDSSLALPSFRKSFVIHSLFVHKLTIKLKAFFPFVICSSLFAGHSYTSLLSRWWARDRRSRKIN